VGARILEVSLPVIIFDTSALSFLIKDGPRSAPHVAALACGFDVWLTAMSVDEIISTNDPDEREMLVAGLQSLLASGRCICPPHEIVARHTLLHQKYPSAFNWRGVNIRARVYERAIIERDYTEELCKIQFSEQRHLEEEFMKFWHELRTKLQPILDAEPEKRPARYSEAAEIARTGTPSVLLGIGSELYKRGAKTEGIPSEAEIAAFLAACPPFRAVCYGLVGSWFDVSLASRVFRRLAGRNDQMMAIYLPYCSRFVTADGKQETRLREIATETKVECEVLSYLDFLASFEVVA
jgi:hypothetical protein